MSAQPVDELIEAIESTNPLNAIEIFQSHPDLMLAVVETGVLREGYDPPVNRAVAHGRELLLNYLLEEGVDPNGRGFEGETPLHSAARSNNVKAIDLLLAHGADLEAADDWGFTAIDKTIAEGQEGFDHLLKRGAKPGLGSQYGTTEWIW